MVSSCPRCTIVLFLFFFFILYSVLPYPLGMASPYPMAYPFASVLAGSMAKLTFFDLRSFDAHLILVWFSLLARLAFIRSTQKLFDTASESCYNTVGRLRT